ncbi:hypothetical protein BDA99DRAFT_536587 [Phascolomyces articulosus]|uniref:Uncharacterized protein n=1 Tax=Phascolomyces articulosus TaxID=60185 RepID=A0AAD5KB98_9FUNG|nr:hypothetical protein BDA99DRAFT_536587 [Phascolomyces articulosus]
MQRIILLVLASFLGFFAISTYAAGDNAGAGADNAAMGAGAGLATGSNTQQPSGRLAIGDPTRKTTHSTTTDEETGEVVETPEEATREGKGEGEVEEEDEDQPSQGQQGRGGAQQGGPRSGDGFKNSGAFDGVTDVTTDVTDAPDDVTDIN